MKSLVNAGTVENYLKTTQKLLENYSKTNSATLGSEIRLTGDGLCAPLPTLL